MKDPERGLRAFDKNVFLTSPWEGAPGMPARGKTQEPT